MYNIDEENSDISFEVNGTSVAFKVKSGAGGGETGSSVYLIQVGDLTMPTDKNTYSALRIIAEITKYAISKNNDDTANGLITFIKGLKSDGIIKVGDAVDSFVLDAAASYSETGLNITVNAQDYLMIIVSGITTCKQILCSLKMERT